MVCPNKNRERPHTLAFRVSDKELMRVNQRVKILGLAKGEYLRSMALKGNIEIVAGKYKSDRLSVELKHLSKRLFNALLFGEDHDMVDVIFECRYMIDELLMISEDCKSRRGSEKLDSEGDV